MKKIISMGEALIDFIPTEADNTQDRKICFVPQAGGAPANVACCAARLGSESYFITKLSKDKFGDLLYKEYGKAGVKLNYIYRTMAANTGLAFIHSNSTESRDFTFYRNPSADMLLTKDEINPDWLDNCIFHVGSVGLIESPMLYAHIKAIDLVKKKGSILSFDPNIRLNLWKKPEDCLTAVKSIFTLADIVKVSYDEISFITGESDEEEGTMALFQGLNKLVIVTRGNKGASVYTHHFEVSHPGFTVDVVDTTGAGDAFMGAFLHQISKIFKPLENLTPEELFEMLKFSNAVAAISVTKQGAIASLPTLKEVEEFLEKHK